MKRRDVLAGVAGVSGASAVGVLGYEVGTSSDGQAAAPGNESTATPAKAATSTATPTFDPDVSYPSCRSVRVDADAYGPVLASVADGSTVEFDGEFSGEETFETEQVVESVLVYGETGKASVENPAAESCAATEMATEAEADVQAEASTETATETPTETETATPTETATESPTPTPEPEANVSTEFEDAATGIMNFVVKNNNDYSVSVTVRGRWEWTDGEVREDTESDTLGPFAEWEGTLSVGDRENEHAVKESRGTIVSAERV